MGYQDVTTLHGERMAVQGCIHSHQAGYLSGIPQDSRPIAGLGPVSD